MSLSGTRSPGSCWSRRREVEPTPFSLTRAAGVRAGRSSRPMDKSSIYCLNARPFVEGFAPRPVPENRATGGWDARAYSDPTPSVRVDPRAVLVWSMCRAGRDAPRDGRPMVRRRAIGQPSKWVGEGASKRLFIRVGARGRQGDNGSSGRSPKAPGTTCAGAPSARWPATPRDADSRFPMWLCHGPRDLRGPMSLSRNSSGHEGRPSDGRQYSSRLRTIGGASGRRANSRAARRTSPPMRAVLIDAVMSNSTAGRARSRLEEKPARSKSNRALTGLCCHD